MLFNQNNNQTNSSTGQVKTKINNKALNDNNSNENQINENIKNLYSNENNSLSGLNNNSNQNSNSNEKNLLIDTNSLNQNKYKSPFSFLSSEKEKNIPINSILSKNFKSIGNSQNNNSNNNIIDKNNTEKNIEEKNKGNKNNNSNKLEISSMNNININPPLKKNFITLKNYFNNNESKYKRTYRIKSNSFDIKKKKGP